MIKNWEDIVPKRTDPKVMKIIPRVGELIEAHIGKNNQIYSDQIVRTLQDEGFLPEIKKDGREYEIKCLKPYVTKAVNAIRIWHLIRCVASTSRGYYIAETPEEWDEFLASANSRARSANALLLAAEDDMERCYPDYVSEYIFDNGDDDINDV